MQKEIAQPITSLFSVVINHSLFISKGEQRVLMLPTEPAFFIHGDMDVFKKEGLYQLHCAYHNRQWHLLSAVFLNEEEGASAPKPKSTHSYSPTPKNTARPAPEPSLKKTAPPAPKPTPQPKSQAVSAPARTQTALPPPPPAPTKAHQASTKAATATKPTVPPPPAPLAHAQKVSATALAKQPKPVATIKETHKTKDVDVRHGVRTGQTTFLDEQQDDETFDKYSNARRQSHISPMNMGYETDKNDFIPF